MSICNSDDKFHYGSFQSEETLPCIREQLLSHGASQSAMRHHSLSLCTVYDFSLPTD